MYDTPLVIGGKEFTSRLIVGTGKYSSNEIMRQAHEESGAEIVTVAVRRVSLPGKGESILDFIDTKRFTLLPNTAGCYTADEAVRTAYLAREAGLGEMVKLEVIGDARTLFPDVQGLLERSEEHTSELQSPCNLVCRLLLEKKKQKQTSRAALGRNVTACASRV